jgi:hypothetical protein
MATPIANPRLAAELYALSVTADGTRISAAGDAGLGLGLLTVWDGGGAERWLVDLPRAAILCAEWSPAGDMLLFGAEDGRAWLYTRDNVPRRVWSASPAALLACAFTPDGALALTAGADHVIRGWDVESGELIVEMRGHDGAVFALDVDDSGARLVSGGADGAVLLWTMGSDEPDARWSVHDNTVSAVTFMGDDDAIASTGWDGRVMMMSGAGGVPIEMDRLSGPAFALAMAPDGVTLVVGGSAADASLVFWHVPSRSRVLTVAGPATRQVDFVPGAAAFAAGFATGEISLWEADPTTPTPAVVSGFKTTTLRWSDESALYYEVQVGRAQPFRDGDITLLTRDTRVELPEDLVDGTTVWWRVRARGFASATEWSEAQSVISGGPVTSVARVWVNVFPAQVSVGDTVTASVMVEDAVNLRGFQTDVVIEPGNLWPTVASEGDTLRADGTETRWDDPIFASERAGVALLKALAARKADGGTSESGVLLTVELEAREIGTSTIRLRNLRLWDADQVPIDVEHAAVSVTVHARADVTRDGLVDLRDLVFVAAFFGLSASAGGAGEADVDGNGTIDIVDLLLVVREFGTDGAASVAGSPTYNGLGTLRRVRDTLRREGPEDTDPTEWRGLLALLDAAVVSGSASPTEPLLTTAHVYPNPSNPEVWIPFALSERAEVTVVVFDTRGARVKTIALGGRAAGIYQGRADAAHWDGRNDAGDAVSGGLYIARVVASSIGGAPAMAKYVRIVMAR